MNILVNATRDYIQNNRPAILAGNGFNLYRGNSESHSWQGLLKSIIEDERLKVTSGYKKRLLEVIDSLQTAELSNTELFDVINRFHHLSKKEDDSERGLVTHVFAEVLSDWQLNIAQRYVNKVFIRYLKSLDLPLLTTNFDRHFIDCSDLNLELYNLSTDQTWASKFSYPWSHCFSAKKEIDARENFAIWYIHGYLDYWKSIKLGANQYMGMARQARELIESVKENKDFAKNTWLDIFFNKSLVVVGLGLERSETFLRWLLMERSYMRDKFSSKANEKSKDLYLALKNSVTIGKRLLLESCGFEIVEFDSYEDIYENLWLVD